MHPRSHPHTSLHTSPHTRSPTRARLHIRIHTRTHTRTHTRIHTRPQAHLRCDCGNYPPQPGCNNSSVISANMQRFIKLGLKIWVTELDVAMASGCTQERQAAVYRAVLEACLANAPHCDSFMVWGFTDRYTWLKTKDPAMLDAEYRPKPAFFALQRALDATE